MRDSGKAINGKHLSREKITSLSLIESIHKHLSKNLFLLSQFTHYVDSMPVKYFFQAHLLSHTNYASTVWSGASEIHLKKKLISLHRQAVLPLQGQFELNKCGLMFKIQVSKAPLHLSDIPQQISARYGSNKYVSPLPRIDMYEFCFLWLLSLELPPPRKCAVH